MNLPYSWSKATPLFDDEHLVSSAGLAPVMALAEQAGLSQLVAKRVRLGQTGSWNLTGQPGPPGREVVGP